MEKRNGINGDEFQGFIEPLGEPLEGEPDETTDENVSYTLDSLEVEIDAELEMEAYHTIDLGQRASEILNRLGINGELQLEEYIELCKELNVVPESEEGLYAVEDIFFKIKQEDYLNRDLSDYIVVEDLIEAADVVDYEDYQQQLNDVSVKRLSNLFEDPILEYRLLRIKLTDLEARAQTSVKVFDELQAEISETEKKISDLIPARGIPQVKDRRERGIRRLDWLLRQDFMIPIVKDFEKRMQEGNALTLSQAIERIALTRGVDQKAMKNAYDLRNRQIEQIQAKRTELLARFEENMITPEEIREELSKIDGLLENVKSKEPEIKYLPSIIDQLNTLEKEGSNREGYTRKQLRRATLRDSRLKQAGEICEIVFIPDFKDRIYELVDISERELERVELMHRLMHARADISSLERILELMPGGAEVPETVSEEEEKAINAVEALEYGGKKKVEIMEDIADILSERGDYFEEELHRLQQLRRVGQLTIEQTIELGESAVMVIKALVFRHNIPISKLT